MAAAAAGEGATWFLMFSVLTVALGCLAAHWPGGPAPSSRQRAVWSTGRGAGFTSEV